MMAHPGNRMADWFMHIGAPRRPSTTTVCRPGSRSSTRGAKIAAPLAPAPVVPQSAERLVAAPGARKGAKGAGGEALGASPAGSERGQCSSTRSACAPGVRSETSSSSGASSASAVTLPRRRRHPSFSAAASLPSLVPLLQRDRTCCCAHGSALGGANHPPSAAGTSDLARANTAVGSGSDSPRTGDGVDEASSSSESGSGSSVSSPAGVREERLVALAPPSPPQLPPQPQPQTQVADAQHPGISREAYFNIKRLAKAIQSGAFVLFITGAGVSVSSGIKTYRTGPDGLWNNYVYEVCIGVAFPVLLLLLHSLNCVFQCMHTHTNSGEQKESFWKTLRRGGQTFGSSRTTRQSF